MTYFTIYLLHAHDSRRWLCAFAVSPIRSENLVGKDSVLREVVGIQPRDETR